MDVLRIDHESSASFLGATFRRSRPGPEQGLIEEYLARHPIHAPSGQRVAVFHEPKLQSGFPDLVIVQWAQSRIGGWNEARSELTPEDIRLVHFIHQAGPTDEAALLNRGERSVASSIKRLIDAGFLTDALGQLRTKPLEEIFALQRITAIEAKIAEWEACLQQARLNTWFASESFVLLPRVPRYSVLLNEALHAGVGVLTTEDHDPNPLPATPWELPRSYASWLFNEWAWRASMAQAGHLR